MALASAPHLHLRLEESSDGLLSEHFQEGAEAWCDRA